MKITLRAPSAFGSPGIAARIVGTLFFFGFFAIGSTLTYQVARGIWNGAKTYFWDRVPCRILESSVATGNGEENLYVFQVRYRYEVSGRGYESSTYRSGYEGGKHVGDAERLTSRYPAGSDALCRVDPKAPERSTLERPSPWRAFLILFPLVFVAVGGVGSWAIWSSVGGKAPPAAPRALSKSAVSARKAAGCLAGFFGIFFLAGVGFSLFFVVPAVRSVAARSWSAVPCRVLSSEVRTHADDDGATYSVAVLYEYELGGRRYRSDRYHFFTGSSSGYESKAKAAARYAAGSPCTCFVNPADPHDAVLVRSFGSEYLFALLPLVFVVVGAGGIFFALRQARRVRAGASPGAIPEAPAGRFAFAPEEARRGPVALQSMGPVGRFLVTTGVAIFWNGIVAVFLWRMVAEWRAGAKPWGLTCFLVPFVLVGMFLVVAAVSNLLATFNPRVRLTLSSPSIPLGGSATISWTFGGGASRVSRVVIAVEGREEASYRSGDSTHTDRSVFAAIPVFDASAADGIASGTAKVSIPAGTMHSFAASHNKIVWTLKLRGEIPSWPDVTQDYELDVRPDDELDVRPDEERDVRPIAEGSAGA